nr:hypothetical protein [Escherichia coli]
MTNRLHNLIIIGRCAPPPPCPNRPCSVIVKVCLLLSLGINHQAFSASRIKSATPLLACPQIKHYDRANLYTPAQEAPDQSL